MIPVMSLAAKPEPAVVVAPVADVWSRPLARGRKACRRSARNAGPFRRTGPHPRIQRPLGPHRSRRATGLYASQSNGKGIRAGCCQNQLGPSASPRADKTWTSVETFFRFAESAIGTPYLWGGLFRGRAAIAPDLIHLAYRLHGITNPPRCARAVDESQADQAGGAESRRTLIFSAKADDPKKITHVALYAGDGQIIEAPQTGLAVRKISFKEKYGEALEEVESGDRVGDKSPLFRELSALTCRSFKPSISNLSPSS